MKKLIIVTILLLCLGFSTTASGQLEVNSAQFSSEMDLSEQYSWNVENYQVGETKVEVKSSPSSFELVDDSRIDLVVEKDPSNIDLAKRGSLTNGTGLDDYFSLSYDDIDYEFDNANQLYLWVFPTKAVSSTGNNIDLISEFWIHNVYNILANGDVYEFNSTLPDAEIKSSTSEGETTVNYETDDVSIQAKIDEVTGITNEINFISNSPDFRIEIDRRGGGSFLPISPIPIVIAFVAIPLAIRFLRKNKRTE